MDNSKARFFAAIAFLSRIRAAPLAARALHIRQLDSSKHSVDDLVCFGAVSTTY